MKKVYFYIIGLLVLGIILFFVFTQGPNQTQNLYDAVDASVEQFLKK